jgi:hypothetical protein
MNLIYAVAQDNVLKHIDEVPNGAKCNCFCPACKRPLIAKNEGKVKEHHFAHQGENNCVHGYETQLHLIAKEVFKEIKELRLPKINFEIEPMLNVTLEAENEILIKSVVLENKISDIVPDILISSTNGFELIIEIKVFHGIDNIKLQKIKSLNLNCIEINLEGFVLESINQLKEILLNDFARWTWIVTKNKDIIQSQLIKATETIETINVADKKITKFCPLLKSEIGIKGQTCADLNVNCKNCPFNLGISTFENQIQCGGKLKVRKIEELINIDDSTKIDNQIIKITYQDKSVLEFSPLLEFQPKKIMELWNGKPILVKNVITKFVFLIKKNPVDTIKKYRRVYGDIYIDGILREKNKEIFYYKDSQWFLIPKTN